MKNNVQRRKGILFPVLAAAVFAMITLFPVMAGATINVTPVITETNLNPGESIKGYYTVANPSDQKVYIHVQTIDWLNFLGNHRREEVKWISFPVMDFEINAREAVIVSYHVSIPKDNPVPERAAMIYFLSKNENMGIGTPVNVKVGVPYYVFNGNLEKTGFTIGEIKTVADDVDEMNGISHALKLSINISNYGSTHIRPEGKISLHGTAGALISQTALLSGEPVFPGTINKFWAELKCDLKPGIYRIVLDISPGKRFPKDADRLKKEIRIELKNTKEIVIVE